jgi:hypothetical protein
MAKKKVTKKAVKRQNVSEKLGLTRLEKATPKACRERAKELDAIVAKKKLPKALLEKAKRWATWYRARAKSA